MPHIRLNGLCRIGMLIVLLAASAAVSLDLSAASSAGQPASQEMPSACTQIASPIDISSPDVLGFDDLGDQVQIADHYLSAYGVQFGGEPMSAQAWTQADALSISPPNVAYNHMVSGSNRNEPFYMIFNTLRTDVGFYMGNAGKESLSATMRGYDSQGHEICTAFADVPEDLSTFVGIHDPDGQISWVTLDYGDTEQPETIDNLFLAPAMPHPPITANLTITDIWSDAEANICYQIMNTGEGEAPAGHFTGLVIDGNEAGIVLEQVSEVLSPGERFSTCFSADWSCSEISDQVEVIADRLGQIDPDLNDDNSRTETFKCDTHPPSITTPPEVTDLTSSSAVISWTTDEESNSIVDYDTVIGDFSLSEQEVDLVTAHSVQLSGLTPKTTYQFRLRSLDLSGSETVSEPGFFETKPEADSTAPTAGTATAEKQDSNYLSYILEAPASDNQKVERVEFFLDGELVGTDFTPGDKGAAPGVYQADLVPALLDLTRVEFSASSHTLTTKVYDVSGLSTTNAVSFTPPPEPFHGNVEIQSPVEDYTLYIPGSTVPNNTNVTIQALAERLEENCYRTNIMDPNAPHPIRCDPYSVVVDHVVMRIVPPSGPTVTVCDLYPPSGSTNRVYECAWNAAGRPLGTYTVQVQAYGPGGTTLSDSQYMEIETGSADLEITRHVARTDHYFQVSLDLHNPGTLPVSLQRLEDTLTLFQPITQTNSGWRMSTSFSDGDYINFVTLTPNAGGSQTLTIQPGATETVSYKAIPVLFDNYLVLAHQFGAVAAMYTTSGIPHARNYTLSNRTTDAGEDLETAVLRARQAASYLIVTSPWRMPFTDSRNNLLAGLAELAYLKNGILGYTGERSGGGVDRQATGWGSEMRGSDGVARHWSSNGYMLIVGETEIIGSFDDQITHWILTNRTIHYSDNNYGDTNGDLEPEVMVGRVQGDNIGEMLATINNIVNVAKGTPGYVFDRTEALVVAGQGDGQYSFEGSARIIRDHLSGRYTVTYGEEHGLDHLGLDKVDWMANNVLNKDVIVYRDHCSGSSWGDVATNASLSWGEHAWNFGNHRPFAFAICCEAGRYKDVGEFGILESVMYKGAAVYIGATEVSDRITNNDYGEYFFLNWSPSNASIGAVLKQAENNFDGFYDDSWRSMYNLYGDPSYGGGSSTLSSQPEPGLFAGPPLEPEGSIAEVTVDVPAYTVKDIDGVDLVTFEGAGQEMLVGYPVTPKYPVRYTVPDGMWVADVRLTAQAYPDTITDLNLKIAAEEYDCVHAAQSPAPLALQNGLQEWPESFFDWDVETTADGGSDLVINLRPLRYFPLQAVGQFTDQFTFEIELVERGAGILFIQPMYPWFYPDEPITTTLWISATSVPQDLLLSAAVINLADGKQLTGLPAQTLEGATGLIEVQLVADSTGLAPGQHTLQVELRDPQGNVMDRAYAGFTTGYAAGTIYQLDVPQEPFELGDQVPIGVHFQNAGNVTLDGTIVVRIQNLQGGDPVELTQEFSNIVPPGTFETELTWDTSGAAPGDFLVTAYALYKSESTAMVTANISSYDYIYLPALRR